MNRKIAFAAMVLICRALVAQQGGVTYHEDFQAYAAQSRPYGWDGAFAVSMDPVDPRNLAFGTHDSPEGGRFAILSAPIFGEPLEFRGRMLRTSSDSRMGVAFFSGPTERDPSYLISLEQSGGKRRSVRSNAITLTMELSGRGGASIGGTLDSGITPDPGRWYDFVIVADEFNNATAVRARFWPSGTPEPDEWQIDARDTGLRRLDSGRIGLWAASEGDTFFDDLSAQSGKKDEAATEIHFFDADTQKELSPESLALFRKPARVEVRVTGGASAIVKLDGEPWNGTPIAVDGVHEIAVDTAFISATLRLLVDQTPPVLALLANGAPLVNARVFDGDVVLDARATDVSQVRITSSVGALPMPLAAEAEHSVTATAVDQVGWESVATGSFTIDKTPPTVTVLANGVPFLSGASFRQDVALTWSAVDATLDTMTASLDGNPVQSGVVVSAAAVHTVVVIATDRAGHTTRVTRDFALRREAPEVRVLANGAQLESKTYGLLVAITADISDPTPTQHEATLDGAGYILGAPIPEGRHVFQIVVRNAAGLETTIGPIAFSVDVTPPSVTVIEAGTPFVDGMKFKRDVMPVIHAQDNLAASPQVLLIIDGREYPTGVAIVEERAEHALTVTATDEAGLVTTAGPYRFVLDKTKPIVSLVSPALNSIHREPVLVRVGVEDLTSTTIEAKLAGASIDINAPVAIDGAHQLTIIATDIVGWQSDPAVATFTIDTVAPVIRLTSPASDAVVGTPVVEILGYADDAVSITVNGVPAVLDTATKTFAARDVPLLEGANVLSVVAVDRAGNSATDTFTVHLDTVGPEIIVTAPAANACLDANSVTVTGTALDREFLRVTINGVEASVSGQQFTGAVALPGEGPVSIEIAAHDRAGHVTALALPVLVDRTPPTIEVTESGTPFGATLVKRPIALVPRAEDGGGQPTVVTTLNGTPYTPGTPIAADGQYELKIVATDCAGHDVTQTLTFEIDRTGPAILTVTPASGSTIGEKRPVTGTTSPDAVSVHVSPADVVFEVVSGGFAIPETFLGEGTNELRLTVTDRAGNSTEVPYAVTLDLTPPDIEIVESGAPIPTNAVFARDVMPVIRVSDVDATVAATLNATPFVSGTPVTVSGSYTLTATATDALGHTSTQATATFVIDRSGPIIDITAPSDGGRMTADQIEVRGTVVGDDVLSVRVNGVASTITAGVFTALVSLERGPNTIAALAVDRAGNVGTDRVEVTRTADGAGIVLTAPADGTLTNRSTTVVSGQILTVTPETKLTVNGVETAFDAAGFFRIVGHPLTEGENVVTAAITGEGASSNEVSVRVTADRTPPRLLLLESGQPLQDGARFPARAVITAESNEGTAQILVDSASASQPIEITAPGGHTIVATARDAAGNESRVERTIFVGSAGATACRLEDFDPVNRAVVAANTVTISGRSGGAAGVRVNGAPALVSDGTFCVTVELPLEGDNGISVTCTDSSGVQTGDPQTLVLRRVTSAPSLAIELPAEGSVVANETISVRGTVQDAASVEINGTPAVLSGNTWSAPAVRLSSGVNIIVARARNAAGRTTAVSRRVVYVKEYPAITITSPLAALATGATKIDVSGGWSGVDPATLRVNGITPVVTILSDTNGTYVAADVPLQPGANVVKASGTDAAGRVASDEVEVTSTAGLPVLSIIEPADNQIFASDSSDSFVVKGTFTAPLGSTVEVAGEPAVVAETSFTATVRHANGRATPVLVRLTTPDGAVVIDAIRVMRTSARPRVVEHFPVRDAIQVDEGAMPLVLFSAPMDRATTAAAFRLETTSGTPVSGILRLDRDVLTFAPSALLTAGERYTIRVADSARSIGGDLIESAFTSTFTVAASSGTAAPTLNPIGSGCSDTIALTGTAPPNARLRLDVGGLSFTTDANASGAWTYRLPAGGYSGYRVVRVRVAGSDGSFSPVVESCFLVDCAGPRVVSVTFDRSANRIRIEFSKDIKPESVTPTAIVLRLVDNRVVGGTLAVTGRLVTVTPSEDLTRQTVSVEVSTAIEDLDGKPLPFPYTESFPYDADSPPAAGDGSGFISGEVFDAATGRPLGAASIFVDVTATPLVTDVRGRYAARLPEGAHTLRATANGYTTVWRQIVVPAGAGIVPIDIRLTPVTGPQNAATESIPVDGQSLPGLLPLGWSPLAAAVVEAPGTLTFNVPGADVVAAAQVLTTVRYHPDRDEWRVMAAVANIVDGKVMIPAGEPGTYAVVYADKAPHLQRPPVPTSGAALVGVADACSQTPCGALEAESFILDPPLVLPSGKTVATVRIRGASPHTYPSGTAVQAYIDEELRLADGTRVTDPPFTTDLLLYRDLSGTTAVAEFRLAPSPRAGQVVLDVGFSNIRILPYPGRLERGTLIGTEGGRVPGDGSVTIDLPAGASEQPLRATYQTLDVAAFGAIPGFTITAAFAFSLQTAVPIAQPDGLTAAPPELLQSARVTLAITQPGQYLLAEVLDGSQFRLAAQMESIDGGRVTTRVIDRATLPIDGVVREGRYLLLRANSPIAFATGVVRDAGGVHLGDVRVSAPPLGVTDSTRVSGVYAIPVAATPAAPFSLVAYTPMIGTGPVFTHGVAPAADVIVRADLVLQAIPPNLVATEPASAANGVSLTTFVRAHFDSDLDATSIDAASIVVTDAETESTIAADVLLESPRTALWRLRGGENRLSPGRTYSVVVGPTIRGANRAPFGRTHVFRFSTVSQVTSGEIHPEKIRITIPDAAGHSRVIGAASALPTGYIAVVTRRGRDFATPFQATAGADGSFAISVGESVALTDTIDLLVLNTAGAIAAVLPLTPFTSDDGRGFMTSAGTVTRFVSPDGFVVTVPAAAFDEPTLVTATKAGQSVFTTVPAFDDELVFAGGITLEFDGVAKQRLEVEIPTPAGMDPGHAYYLGVLGQSVRGPRMMIVSLLRIDGGKFTTVQPEMNAAKRLVPAEVMTPRQANEYFLGADRSGSFAALTFKEPVGFAFLEGGSALFDLFVDTLKTIFAASHYVAERGRILVPVSAGRPFTVIGVNPATDTTIFRTTYGAIPAGDPGAAAVLPSPVESALGPYPVFTSPARVEVVDLLQGTMQDESIRNLVVTFDGRQAKVMQSALRLPRNTRVEVLNLSTGLRFSSEDFALDTDGITQPARKGDRLLLFIEERFAEPSSAITVAFNKPIYVENPTALRSLFKLSIVDEHDVVRPVTDLLTIEPQSGNRRFVISLPGLLQRGRTYRLTLSPTIRDGPLGPATLQLAQRRGGPPMNDGLHFDFATRAPRGLIGSFDLSEGDVRDLAMNENILFVSALDAGLLAYDVSDPAAVLTSRPFAKAEAPFGDDSSLFGQNWAVATDRHGRVFATGLSPRFGVIRSYRVEDFVQAANESSTGVVQQRSNAIVSWRPGINVGLPLGTSVITVSDRPEAIPRKLRLVSQDAAATDYASLQALVDAYTGGAQVDVGSGFKKVELTITVAHQLAFPYLRQRVTVINQSARFRWSVDVPRNGSAKVTVVGRAGDRFQVIRNLRTFGLISLFGYGLGLFDLNAIESNRIRPGESGFDPSYVLVKELVALTRGDLGPRPPPCDPATAASLGSHCPIPDLVFSPESELAPGPSPQLIASALEANRGILQVKVNPPHGYVGGEVSPASTSRDQAIILAERVPTANGVQWFAHPRLNVLRRLFRDRTEREPVARFTSIAAFTKEGMRYALVAGFEYGVPVVKLDDALNDKSLVDVIWIPAGAMSVRVLDGDSLATVVDGKGRVLLVDLTKVDESRSVITPSLVACENTHCEWPLFPTVSGALDEQSANAGPGEVGADDPRIVWKSEDDLVRGTLPPLIDAETGFVYTGDVGGKTVRVVAAADPRLRLMAEPRTEPAVELQNVVPLGVKPSGNVTNAAAFRVETIFPGSIAESLPGGSFTIALESERVWGGVVGDAPTGWPSYHLRGLPLTRSVPSADDPVVKRLRYQRGWNRFASSPIVALADPRASEQYQWIAGANRQTEGCSACERPEQLRGDTTVREIVAGGRMLFVHAEANVLEGTAYAYLTEEGRISSRVPTIPADTVRAAPIQVAGQTPPVADGAIEETVYVHSGEVASGTVDLVAEGRAGFDVTIDRSYGSRTIGLTPFGFGWTSSLFEHLRELPDGEIEYHDAGGETWRFKRGRFAGSYESPRGLFVRLDREEQGWVLRDQAMNTTRFDRYGRLSSRSDNFADPTTPAPTVGNVIQFLYDANGRLAQIVDPVERRTVIRYNANDLVSEIEDWRGRKVTYAYDLGRLTSVKGPETKSPSGFEGRPETRYAYEPTGSTFTERVDFAANLKSITDPAGDSARVTFEYDVTTNAPTRDRVKKQTWATGETVSFEVIAAGAQLPTEVAITDALGQKRTYSLTAPFSHDGRTHVQRTTVFDAPVFEASESLTKAPLLEQQPSRMLVTEITEWNDHGQIVGGRLPGEREFSMRREPAEGGSVGTRLVETTLKFANDQLVSTFGYDTVDEAKNLVLRVARSAAPGPDENLFRDTPTPSRNRRTLTTSDEDFKNEETLDVYGQPSKRAQKANEGTVETNAQTFEFYDGSAPLIARGRIKTVRRPGDAYAQQFSYETAAGGGDRVTIVDDALGTTTTIDRDPMGRPTHRVITGGAILADETFGYDANGQVISSSRKQDGLGEVVSTTKYDDMLRETESTLSNARVGESFVTLKTTTSWDLANRKITRSDPHIEGNSASEVSVLDSLGRVAEVRRVTGTGQVRARKVFGYDRKGLLSYGTDGQLYGVVHVRDGFGREKVTLDSMGLRQESTWTVWGEPETEKWFDAGALVEGGATSLIGQRRRIFTRGGEVRAVNEELVANAQFRSTRFGWTNGGRETSVRVGPVADLSAAIAGDAVVRLTETHRDEAGRLTTEKTGEGRGFSASFADHGVYAETQSSEYRGAFPTTQRNLEPRIGATFTTANMFDGLGRLYSSVAPGGYSISRTFDQAGNVRTMQVSGHRRRAEATYDSRGLITRQQHEDGSSIAYRYDALGNLTAYRDETGSLTTYETDALGRTTRVKYPDGTCEATVYRPNDDRIAATRTRTGHWLVYQYNGRLVGAIYRGSTAADETCTAPEEPEAPQRGEILVAYIYDAAWRLVAVRNKDAGVEWADFDFAGRPRTTRAVRYKNGTGLAVGGSEHLDVLTQKHEWSLFDGERLRYRMPFAGTDEPPSSAGPWVSWMSEERDAAGNLVALQGSNQVRSKSFARGVGRLSIRERPLGSDLSIRTLYGYAEPDTGQGLPGESDLPPVPRAPGPFSGMLGRAGTTVGDDTLSGTEITRDATARVATAKWLGVGNRESRFRYDDRDRLNRSVLGGFHDAEDPPSIEDVLEPADFRAQRQVNRLTASERALLGRNGPEAELPSFTATRTAAQQIDHVDYRDELPPDVQFAFAGGQRTSDGVWSYAYDEFGRLTQLTRMNPRAEEASRYEYEYNPLNRMVGRRVCSNVNNEPCVLETRTNVLARDGLPNHVTFSWDPITDRLLSISRAGSVDDSGLLRQYIHGDQAYDDPLVVLTPSEAFYPVIDESGTGNLIAVLRNDGTFVERVLYGDSYGASPRYLHGPVVQRVTSKVKRDALGNVIEATFSINVSDALREATVASGARLRSVRSDGSVAFTSAVIPEVDSDDPHTLRWKLDATEWSDLANASGATSIELVVTTSLRAVGWGETPVMAPPAWMRTLNLRTSDSEPFIRRESMFTLLGGGEEERTLWQIADLYLVASPESKAKVLTGFKAAPFVEPSTGLVYLRERWMDPSSGTFLSPDPLSYEDSSNLYAFCTNDPVNCSDPLGLARRTRNGGTNYLGDISKELRGDTRWSRGLGVAADTLGNTVSDLLMLDAWADANVVTWDSSRSASERAWAGTKGLGIAALNLVGGEIAGSLGQVALRIPGVRTVVATVSASAVGRVLATDVRVLANGALDRLLGSTVDDFAMRISPLADDGFGAVTRAEGVGGPRDMGVYFFGDDVLPWIDTPAATLGRTGHPHFFSPLDDVAGVTTVAQAARESGGARSILQAYKNAGDGYGVVFPLEGLRYRVPNAADSGGYLHYLEGGRTAMRLHEVNAGFLLNRTREFVTAGGAAMPGRSVLFRLGPRGAWTPLRRF